MNKIKSILIGLSIFAFWCWISTCNFPVGKSFEIGQNCDGNTLFAGTSTTTSSTISEKDFMQFVGQVSDATDESILEKTFRHTCHNTAESTYKDKAILGNRTKLYIYQQDFYKMSEAEILALFRMDGIWYFPFVACIAILCWLISCKISYDQIIGKCKTYITCKKLWIDFGAICLLLAFPYLIVILNNYWDSSIFANVTAGLLVTAITPVIGYILLQIYHTLGKT